MALTPSSVSEPFLYLFEVKCDFLLVFAPRVFNIQEITLNLGRDKSTKYHSMLAYMGIVPRLLRLSILYYPIVIFTSSFVFNIHGTQISKSCSPTNQITFFEQLNGCI